MLNSGKQYSVNWKPKLSTNDASQSGCVQNETVKDATGIKHNYFMLRENAATFVQKIPTQYFSPYK